MYNLYAQHEPHGLLVRTGRTYASIGKAMKRARELRVKQLEVRDSSLPRSRSLIAVFVDGVQVAS